MKQLTITTESAAQALSDLETVKKLEPFIKREVTLSEAATELGMKLPTLAYHVDKFIKLGLLEVAHELPRKGRAVKVYRSTAKEFFVPFYLTPSETFGQLLFDLSAAGERRFHREAARALQADVPIWGLYLTCGQDNHLEIVVAPSERGYRDSNDFFGPEMPATFTGDGEVRLDFATAKAFQKDLLELFQRYRRRDTEKGQLYAYRLGLAPLVDETLN